MKKKDTVRIRKKQRICGGVAIFVVLAVAALLVVYFSQSEKTKTENSDEAVVGDGVAFDYEEAGMIRLGEYEGIHVSVEPDEEDVDLELGSVLDEFEAAKGDVILKKGEYAYIDYEGTLDSGWKPDGMQGEDVLIKVGDYHYVKEFEDSLIGRKTGETYRISMIFSEDYPDEEVAGQKCEFEINVKAKFNDHYADEISNGKYKTAEEYRDKLSKKLKKENLENLSEMAWDTFVEKCTVENYPKAYVTEEVDNLNKQYASFAEISGISYEELMESLMMDEESVKETAKDIVRDRMLAKTIAGREKIVPDDSDMRKYLIFLMDYEDDGETLDELYEEYREDYGSRPKDDVLVEMVKDRIAKAAVTD